MSLAEACVHPEVAWPRLILDGDQMAGFVMGAFDPGNKISPEGVLPPTRLPADRRGDPRRNGEIVGEILL